MIARFLIGTLFVNALASLAADATNRSTIGFARATGEFTVDGFRTRNNSTVLHGAVISTANSASHVILGDGTKVDLGLDSRGRIFRDHLVLEKGLAQVQGAGRYAVIAENLKIGSAPRILVRLGDSRSVAVTAVRGTAEVRNAQGFRIAMIAEQRTLEFQPTQDSSRWQVTGCLQNVRDEVGGRVVDHYVLRDETTGIVVELTGPNLEQHLGKVIRVTGSVDLAAKPVSGASHVIHTNLSRERRCQCESVIATVESAGGGPGLPGDVSVVQGAQVPPSSGVFGCLQKYNHVLRGQVVTHYVLRDEITGAVMEIVGRDLEQYAGRLIAVTGSVDQNTKPVAGALRMIRVTNLALEIRCGCTPSIASAANAGALPIAAAAGSVAAGAAAGLPAAATIAIVGGVAAAGTVGGMAAAGVFSDGEPLPVTPSPSSR